MNSQLKTPVAFIIFNRPDCTKRVFAEIRKARPEKLYLIADAPRPAKKGEAEKCRQTRSLVESMIDWPCKVEKNYADTNMGCGKRIPSGLDWVFEHEESAIIMEDDILPDPTFFTFCSSMLEEHKTDESIFQICGYNQLNYRPPSGDYFFSRYGDIWGWATWRRAWKTFSSFDAAEWGKIRQQNSLSTKIPSSDELEMCTFILDQIFSGKLNTWAMRWHLARTMQDGLSITGATNLTKNIGFGFGASHTINPITRHQLIKVSSLNKPYNPPHTIIRDSSFEKEYERTVFHQNRFTEKLRNTLLHLFKK